MTSKISEIFMGYKKALDASQNYFESEYKNRAQNGKDFYDLFFKDLICDFSIINKDEAKRRSIKKDIERCLGSDNIRFAAIDGTFYKEELGYYAIFFGAAYGIKGNIEISGDPPQVKYEKWSMDQDKSLVAYIPIPFAEIDDFSEKDQFLNSDSDRLNLSGIHQYLMVLAEVYLAYDFVKASSLRPNVLLLYHALTYLFSYRYYSPEDLNLVGINNGFRKITKEDILIALSHPYNKELGIPSPKKYSLRDWAISNLLKYKEIEIESLVKESGIPESELLRILRPLYSNQKEPIAIIENNKLKLNSPYETSWDFMINFFETRCQKLFIKKDQSALLYEKEDADSSRRRWMSPEDIKFLINIGIRRLFELCWEHEVLLFGIYKDSSTKSLTKNYLGINRYLENYKFDDTVLPWTDRMYLETLPFCDTSLSSPWCTIEYDGIYSQLGLHKEITNEINVRPENYYEIGGIRNYILSIPENMIAKSLAQFYINRKYASDNPTTGHVIFIERLIHPKIDKEIIQKSDISNDALGQLKPMFVKNKETNNVGQSIMIFILNILTKNLYPEVIGYPDPLHKADWGAKNLQKKIQPIISSSSQYLKKNPLNQTFRNLRKLSRRV